MKILSIAKIKIGNNRGTPLRIFNILKVLSSKKDVDLYTSSLDKKVDFSCEFHFQLKCDFLYNIFNLIKIIKKNEIDLIIGHTINSWIYLFFIKIFLRKKIVLEMHGFLEEELKLSKKIGFVEYWFYKIKYYFFYKSCDLITTCSETAQRRLLRYNKNVIAIFGGVDRGLFNPFVKPKGSVKKNENDIIFGYAGNSRIWQGLDFLLNEFEEIICKYPNTKLFVLLSDNNGKFRCNNKNIVFLEALEYQEVSSFLIECDVLVIPRPKNPVNDISFPSKLLEYLSMGKPVLASKTSDIHKVVDDGVSGVLYEPGDSQGFQQKAIKLIVDDVFKKSVGSNAYKISKKYTWVNQVDILYNNLIKL